MLENEKFEIDEINQGIIEYYANPSDQRTQQQLADDLKVHVTTISRRETKYHKQIFEAVKEKRKQYLPKLVAKGYKTLESKLSRSPKMLEMLFKMAGELVEKIEQTNKYESVDVKRQKLGELLGKFGVKLVVDGNSVNGSQLPPVESKTPSVPQMPNKANNSL